MALTIGEILRAVNPNIGLVVNPDGSYRIGVEDVNSDEVLAALLASGVDLAALEVLIIAINTALQAGGVTHAQLAAILTATLPATVETPFTGTGNIAVGVERIAPGAAFKLTEIVLHLSAAPTTGAQNLVVSVDDGSGTVAYDENILTIDLVANAVTDLVLTPNKTCKAADVITAAWTNTDGRTFGLKYKHQLV